MQERINKLENRWLEIIQTETEKRKRLRKKLMVSVTCGIALSSLTYVIGVWEVEKRDDISGKIFEELVTKY